MTLANASHRRKNALTGEWVLVSPHRTQRPWQGQIEKQSTVSTLSFDPECYLCPGNNRAAGQINPPYTGPFAFDNDFPALTDASTNAKQEHELFQAEAESGRCKVLCYTHAHDESLASLSPNDLRTAINFLRDEYLALDSSKKYAYVQLFENRGEMMGCSNSHPHAQMWASLSLPNEVAKEDQNQARYFAKHSQPLLLDYLAAELQAQERVLWQNESAVALIPYWAIWPYETLIVPRQHRSSLRSLSDRELFDFALALQQTLKAYNTLFDTQVPYSLGFHGAPCQSTNADAWQLHIHIYPPLLRSATIRKHLVGYEMLATPQRDLTPELAASQLRSAYSQSTN